MELELSQEFHDALDQYGYPRMLTVRVCSKCGKTNEEVGAGNHPLHAEVVKIRQRLESDRRNEELSKYLFRLVNKMHNRSRCCIEPRINEERDDHVAKWLLWKERYTRPHNSIAALREEFGKSAHVRDDDFMLLYGYLGVADSMIGTLLKIFREEDARQMQTAQAVA